MASTVIKADVVEDLLPVLARLSKTDNSQVAPDAAGYVLSPGSEDWEFEFTVTEACTGIYRLTLEDGDGIVVAQGYVDIVSDDTGPYRADASYEMLALKKQVVDDFLGGSGARSVTIIVDDGTNPIVGASVRMTAGAESYILPTNGSGQVSFSLDDATYTVTITKAGYTFTPVSLLVAGTVTQTYSMTQVSVPADSPSADQVTGYLYTYDEDGVIEGSVIVNCTFVKPSTTDVGRAYDTKLRQETSNGSGLVQFSGLWKGATYEFKRAGANTRTSIKITIPTAAADPYELPSIYGADE